MENLKTYFINVAGGDAIFIQNEKDGKTFNILVDGGGYLGEKFQKPLKGYIEEISLNSTRINISDFLNEKNIKTIDILINTHYHEDHIGGFLEFIKGLDIKEYWCIYDIDEEHIGKQIEYNKKFHVGQYLIAKGVNDYNEVFEYLKNKGTKIKIIKDLEGEIVVNEDIVIDVLGPSEEDFYTLWQYMDEIYKADDSSIFDALDTLNKAINCISMPLHIKYKGTAILLCSDVPQTHWDGFLECNINLDSEILKVAHHGQSDALTSEFLQYIQPKHIVISTGIARKPHDITCEIIKDYLSKNKEARVYITDDLEMERELNNGYDHKETKWVELLLP